MISPEEQIEMLQNEVLAITNLFLKTATDLQQAAHDHIEVMREQKKQIDELKDALRRVQANVQV